MPALRAEDIPTAKARFTPAKLPPGDKNYGPPVPDPCPACGCSLTTEPGCTARCRPNHKQDS